MIEAVLQRIILFVWGICVALVCVFSPVQGIRLVLRSCEFMQLKVSKRGTES